MLAGGASSTEGLLVCASKQGETAINTGIDKLRKNLRLIVNPCHIDP
jgi:hypothetical protein